MKLRAHNILKVKWGYNPNSSSLGTVVSVLLLGSTLSYLATVFMAAWLRIRARFGR